MAHGISEKDSIWLYREPAWHGLGTVSDQVIKTVDDLFKAHPQLDWDVDLVPFIDLRRLTELAKSTKLSKNLVAEASEFAPDGLKAIVRSDTGDVLAVVTDRYETFNNREAFSFLESVLGELRVETAFSLWGGKQVGLLTRIPEFIEVGGDQVARYIYLRTRHDGTGSRWVWPTAVRVVCANTDRMALTEAGGPDSPIIHKIRHIGDQTQSQRVQEARAALKVSIDYGKQFKKWGDRLAKQKIAEKKVADVLAELYPAGTDTDKAEKSAQRRRDAVMAIFLGQGAHPETQGNAPGSKWCAFNAITEYEQHDRLFRSSESRFVRAMEDPEGVQRKALELLTAN